MTRSESGSENHEKFTINGSYSDELQFDTFDSMKQAEDLFHKLVGSSEDSYLNYHTSLDCSTTDGMNAVINIYKQEIKELKKEKKEILEEKENEIQMLRDQLKTRKWNIKDLDPELSKPQMKLKKKKPIDYQFKKIITLHNNVEVKTIVCHFFPEQEKIGIVLKKVNHEFYIKRTMENSQCCKYLDIVRGLLISEVIWWTPGNNTGTRITASSAPELAQKIKSSLKNGKNITMKFIIPSSRNKGLHNLEKVYVTNRFKKNIGILFMNFGKRKQSIL